MKIFFLMLVITGQLMAEYYEGSGGFVNVGPVSVGWGGSEGYGYGGGYETEGGYVGVGGVNVGWGSSYGYDTGYYGGYGYDVGCGGYGCSGGDYYMGASYASYPMYTDTYIGGGCGGSYVSTCGGADLYTSCGGGCGGGYDLYTTTTVTTYYPSMGYDYCMPGLMCGGGAYPTPYYPMNPYYPPMTQYPPAIYPPTAYPPTTYPPTAYPPIFDNPVYPPTYPPSTVPTYPCDGVIILCPTVPTYPPVYNPPYGYPPTNPTWPSFPTTPTNPTIPTSPSNPTNPLPPGTHNPTNPTNPSNPTGGSDPTGTPPIRYKVPRS